ncbi:ABC transporter ATP-binding protein [Comamonas piscis]|uniref:ABC transporter ATP-binding protein n=1 Tax=Comamonas piscis TaxID=1562974 RepID=A0A7G5ECX7_9BURK|nr:ABC transporter ATP-binding protein [Comamonas piscis]QMV71852.1 ABC transporter ATP-binding protein [Comamonas piscis]WSO34585.1 ABC transporter ATP-binding protein [Comamonas piscis]
MTVLTVTNIGKAYKRYPSKWLRAWEWVSRRITHEKTWVLRDISFVVQPGEALGIIGVNGAGKSTLLKIITGTTQPTQGSVASQGRVAALLELGMGFHPDFTGRQNVFMAGQLLGLSHEEIVSQFSAIQAFAEIGNYMDRPVRMYSSGMQMRLAFSVATAVRPDVLIVDEALSVGDAYFQHKCFNKIREFREQGTSLLIVSHDRGAIQSLCSRALLLEKGLVIKDGKPEEVMDYYNALIAERETATVKLTRLADGRVQTTSGTGEARVHAIALFNAHGEASECIHVGEQVQLKVTIDLASDLPDLVFGYMIKDRLGQAVFGTNTHHLKLDLKSLQKGSQFTLIFSFAANLGVGSYAISTALHLASTHMAANFEWKDLALVFNVINVNHTQFIGVNWIPPQVECQR